MTTNALTSSVCVSVAQASADITLHACTTNIYYEINSISE